MKRPRFWIGFTVTFVFLGLFLWRVDSRELLTVLAQANYVYVLPALLLYFGSVYFRTLRWRYLLSPMKVMSVARLYPVVVVGYMANNLLPVRLGEIVRAYFLSRREMVSSSNALATILLERVFDGLILLTFVAVVALALPVLGVVEGLAANARFSPLLLGLAVPVIFLGAASTMAFLTASPQRSWRVALVVLRHLPPALVSRLEPLALRFLEGFWVLRSPRRVFWLFLLSLPVWLAEAAMYLVIAYSFSLETAFEGALELTAVVLLLTAVSNLATSLPSSPGGVGPFEFFAKGTLVLLGVGAEQATAYAGVLHILLLVPVTLLGLLYLRLGDLSLGKLTREVARPGSRPGEAASKPMQEV